jgi:TPR repeat protein
MIKLNSLSALAISLLLTAQVAHADFRKALDAFIARDSRTMLKQVHDAVDKKNDDGIILFLGILQAYPKSWRSMLNEGEQAELFAVLEVAVLQTGLQAQYKLAVIPRKESNPPPIPTGTEEDKKPWYEARKQEKIKQYREEVTRLEPVADKGYAPAAIHLYGNYEHYLTKSKEDQDHAIEWLIKAAQLGSVQAAYLLGVKYLNIVDGLFGCTSSGHHSPPKCQLSKDEVQGWYWIREAAKHANAPSMRLSPLDDLSLNMGDLYMQGVAGSEPDYEQAYLWYLRMPYGFTIATSPIWEKLEDLKKIGQLKRLNPILDQAWGNATTWQEAVRSQQVIDAFKKSPNKLPSLIQQKTINNKPEPVFSMSTVRWFKPNLSYGGIVLDVYADGRVNLLFGDASFNESNDELLIRVKPSQIRKFIDEFNKLNFIENYIPGYCESGCLESLNSFIIAKERLIKLEHVSFERSPGLSNPYMKQVFRVVEKYYPLLKLTCDADVGEGKRACYQIYEEIISSARH